MKIKKSINHIIVKVDNPYKEEFDIKGYDGQKLVRDHRYHDPYNSNDFGEVIAVPDGCEIPIGATLYFHYSIVEWREKNVSEGYCLDQKEGIFRVPYYELGHEDPLANMAYLWEKDGYIETINDWIILKQEEKELETTESGLVLVKKIDDVIYSTGEAAPKQGFARVKYLNKYFRDAGLNEDDLVIMRKDSEYAIEINGETYWRVWDRFLLAKIEAA